MDVHVCGMLFITQTLKFLQLRLVFIYSLSPLSITPFNYYKKPKFCLYSYNLYYFICYWEKIVRTLINKQKTLFITSVRLFANQCFIIVANKVGNGKGKACKKGKL